MISIEIFDNSANLVFQISSDLCNLANNILSFFINTKVSVHFTNLKIILQRTAKSQNLQLL